MRRPSLSTEALANAGHIAALISPQAYLFGEKATIPRRLHLLNNDHVCQPPPSAL
jgi:hypothetical protein